MGADGSETGGPEDDYAIYIDPDDGSSFPGLGYVQAVLGMPFEKAKQWFRDQPSPEHQPLLGADGGSRVVPREYGSTSAQTDSDEEGYASSTEFPSQGYVGLYAFPSIPDQKVNRYREKVLLWGTVGSFIASFVLLAGSGILMATGRNKLRVEVDAGVAVGVMLSLFCACTALGMTLNRRDPLSIPYHLMVWSAFTASCLLNGMLLVLVGGSTP